jgi:hypothetical protein
MSQSQAEPRIAATLVNGVRRGLIEDGTWERVEAAVLAREPMLPEWLQDANRAEWVTLEGYLRFMGALLDVLGADAMIELGATRFRADVDVGPLGPMLRGWIREFARDTNTLLRVAPHAWQAITRDAGRMVVVSSGPDHIRFRLDATPAALLTGSGWHLFLSGFGTELLRRSGHQGSFSVAPDDGGDPSLVFEGRWSADAGA